MAFLLLVMVLMVRMSMERSTGLLRTGKNTFKLCILVLLQNDKTMFEVSV